MSFSFCANAFKAVCSGKPWKLNYALTYLCNSKCTTCGIWKKYTQDEFNDQPGLQYELSLDEVEKTFINMPSSIVCIGFTGGEPFLRKDVASIIEAAAGSLPALSLITLPSNGLDGDAILSRLREIASIKKRPQIMVHFSLDGPSEINDKIRGKDNSYKKTWSTYTRVINEFEGDSLMRFGIECTVSKNNAEEVLPFVFDLIDKGHNVSLNFAQQAGFYNNLDEESPSADLDKINIIVDGMRKRLRLYKTEDIIKRVFLNKVSRFFSSSGKMIMPCSALESSFALDPYGNVFPCLMWQKKIGSLKETNYDVKPILESVTARKTIDQIKSENCPVCWTMCEASHTILTNLFKRPHKVFFN